MPYKDGNPTLGEQIDEHMEIKEQAKEYREIWDEAFAEGKAAADEVLRARVVELEEEVERLTIGYVAREATEESARHHKARAEQAEGERDEMAAGLAGAVILYENFVQTTDTPLIRDEIHVRAQTLLAVVAAARSWQHRVSNTRHSFTPEEEALIAAVQAHTQNGTSPERESDD